MGDYPSYTYGDDDHDDLAALDFSAPGDAEPSGLDAFDAYTTPDDTAPVVDQGWPAEEAESDEPAGPLFTVTNPSGAVSVSALIDGRVHQIDLAAKTAGMTEDELAGEIVAIAGLARQQARSAQYAFISEAMRELGQDEAQTREFLEQSLGLPSPDQARAQTAQLFATRYEDDHE